MDILLLASALAFGAAPALAQQAPPPVTNTQSSDTVGPKELQDFKLNGTVTRPADRPVPVETPRRPARSTTQSPATSPTATATAPAEERSSPAPVTRRTEAASAEPAPARTAAPEPSDPAPVVDPPASSFAPPTTDVAERAPPPSFAPAPQPAGTLAPEHSFPMLPWLLAAFALAGAGAFLFWRNRGREAFAGGPHVDAFTAPEPAPAPAPAPPPAAPKPASPPGLGLVSTRLRPWIEIGFHPVRCVLDNEKVTVEFELELFNSGSAPARAVLAEASLFNAGPAQDQQIGAFFAKPVGEGERIVVMPPLKRVTMRTQVFVARDQIQVYEIGGRQVFVPLIAFNVIYNWSGGDAQTSAAYLLGKDTKAEKLGPFRLDLGPRIFRGIAARPLPGGVRR